MPTAYHQNATFFQSGRQFWCHRTCAVNIKDTAGFRVEHPLHISNINETVRCPVCELNWSNGEPLTLIKISRSGLCISASERKRLQHILQDFQEGKDAGIYNTDFTSTKKRTRNVRTQTCAHLAWGAHLADASTQTSTLSVAVYTETNIVLPWPTKEVGTDTTEVFSRERLSCPRRSRSPSARSRRSYVTAHSQDDGTQRTATP